MPIDSITAGGCIPAIFAGIAIGMGSTQAVGRAYMSRISPPARHSEFFGFYLQCNKLGAIFSLMLFGLISGSTGSQRLAVLSVIPFFVIGLVLVLSIDDDQARQVAASGSPPAALSR